MRWCAQSTDFEFGAEHAFAKASLRLAIANDYSFKYFFGIECAKYARFWPCLIYSTILQDSLIWSRSIWPHIRNHSFRSSVFAVIPSCAGQPIRPYQWRQAPLSLQEVDRIDIGVLAFLCTEHVIFIDDLFSFELLYLAFQVRNESLWVLTNCILIGEHILSKLFPVFLHRLRSLRLIELFFFLASFTNNLAGK